MSLSWRNRYTAVIGPDRVTVIRRRRGWRAAYDLKLDAAIAPDADADRVGAALASLLARPEMVAGDLSVVLSNSHARFQLIPWDDDLSDPAEMRAFARLRFEQVYGAEAAGWAVEVAPEGADRPRVAVAVEQHLVDQIRAAVAASPLTLRSVQPYLIAAFNRLRKEFRLPDFTFVVAETSRTCLLAARGGRWRGVRAGSGCESAAQLADLIDRELQLMGFSNDGSAPVFVHAPQRARLQLPPIGNSRPLTLSLPLPVSLAGSADQHVAMAMAVA